MYMYSMDTETMLSNANTAKEVVLAGLEAEGLLKGTAKEIGEKYALVAHKKGWFGSLWSRMFEGKKDDAMLMTLVKKVSP